MIEMIVFMWCDGCRQAGPTGITTRSVRRAAKRLGWLIRKPTTQDPHTTRALCPTCVVAHALVIAP